MALHTSVIEEKRLLETRMVYGNYPQVNDNPRKEKRILHELAHSYLYKDLLRYEGIKKASPSKQAAACVGFTGGE